MNFFWQRVLWRMLGILRIALVVIGVFTVFFAAVLAIAYIGQTFGAVVGIAAFTIVLLLVAFLSSVEVERKS